MTLLANGSVRGSCGIPKRALAVAAVVLCGACLSACGMKPKDVWVYVDNAGEVRLEISVDDRPVVHAAPGEFAKIVLPPGEHRFLIKCGEEVVCDLARNLEASDRFATTRKYLFNPDKLTRYQTYDAKYGENRFAGVMQAGLMSFQKDPQIKRQYAYKQLLKEVKLVPSDAWNDVTGIDYVLTAPPDRVMSKGSTERTVLSRVKPRLYAMMERMAKIEQPSDEDIDSLDELLDEMFAEAL
jgi:hypothetical protein